MGNVSTIAQGYKKIKKVFSDFTLLVWIQKTRDSISWHYKGDLISESFLLLLKSQRKTVLRHCVLRACAVLTLNDFQAFRTHLDIWAKLSKIKQPLIRCTGIFIIYSCTTMCNGGKKINLFFGSEVNERAQHLPKIYFSVWPLYMVWPLHTK